MAGARVKIIPLGGYGEVGKNSTAIQCEDDLVAIDCGLMFPGGDLPGIDLAIPDCSYLVENRHRLRGLILTHGHEDHLGALPHVLPKLDVPVYGTKLTQGLLTVKLKEHGLRAKQVIVRPGERVAMGGMSAEFFHVNHSIPGCVGLALRTKAGIVVHTSDFKFDQTPTDGAPTDFGKLAELGARGALALICDCVRVERPGYTPSERVVAESLDQIFFDAPGRIIFTTFASNISRVQQALNAAYRFGRRMAIVGRSLENNVAVATELGYLEIPEDTLVGSERMGHYPAEEMVVAVTGSQGEPTSVLARIAADDHRQIKIAAGDTVIISASPVPGNEQTVSRTIDSLFRLGADVVYGALRPVHVSGHASQEEIKFILNLVRPQFCVPFHGDYRQMVLFQRLAGQLGFPAETVLLPELGQGIEFGDGKARFSERVQAGTVLVDGLTVGDVGQAVIRDRRQLAEDGVLLVSLVLDREKATLIGRPQIASRGFAYAREGDNLIEEACAHLLANLDHGPAGSAEQVSRAASDSLTRFVYERTHRRPLILPVVNEV
ncbi:MAG: ribonuclease J [Chloroflexi bacterium]|nr:ribonuclease J [Chloroflexota bacterium]MCL5108139.1 ribonuclease J [Chloroflexota bacterium]